MTLALVRQHVSTRTFPVDKRNKPL